VYIVQIIYFSVDIRLGWDFPFWGDGMENEEKKDGRSAEELDWLRRRVHDLEESLSRFRNIEGNLWNPEKLYRLLAENVNDVIWTVDKNLKITFVSPSVEVLSGYTPQEVRNLPLEKILTPASLNLVHQMNALRVKKKEKNEPIQNDPVELEVFRKDGTVIWIENRSKEILDDQGQCVGFLGVSRDITSRKRAEAEILRRDAILESLRLTAEKILQTGPWEKDLSDVLAHLGRATDATRVFILKNRRNQTGQERPNLEYEWMTSEAKTSDRKIDLTDFSWLDLSFSPWKNRLACGDFICDHDLDCSNTTENLHAPWNIPSFLWVPIFVDRQWWGVIGFEDCLRKRKWSQIEIDAIRAVAGTFGAALRRRDVEESLRQSGERFRAAFEDAAIGMALVSTDGRFLQVNRTLCECLGYSQQELLTMTFQNKVYSEDIHVSLDRVYHMLSGELRSAQVEKRYFHKLGHLVWVQVHSTLVRDSCGNALYFISQFQDITKRKEAEEKIRVYQRQLRSLASRLSLTEERERRRIATELHDNIGQTLAISKIKLGTLKKLVENTTFVDAVEEIRDLIEQAIKYTRSLTFELSPPILYELGFESAVEWLLEHLQKTHRFSIKFEDDHNLKPLSEDMQVVLFQVVRELLMNVVKHAQASEVRVAIARAENYIRIEVEDNGVGFDSSDIALQQHKNHGFGIFSVRERLAYLGANFEIHSQPGCGTKILLQAPLKTQ